MIVCVYVCDNVCVCVNVIVYVYDYEYGYEKCLCIWFILAHNTENQNQISDFENGIWISVLWAWINHIH